MMKSGNRIFNLFADGGDEIIKFIKKSKWHALLIGFLCFISPVNLIMWIMVLCALYRK